MEGTTEMDEAAPQVKTRRDWRTGKQMHHHSGAFWEAHERRRMASGQTISDYCAQHGLAKSTFRRWCSRLAGRERSRSSCAVKRAPATAAPAAAEFLSMPIRSEQTVSATTADAQIEVLMHGGSRVRLYGSAAHRAIEAVMAQLVSAR